MKFFATTLILLMAVNTLSLGQEDTIPPDPCGEGNKKLKDILSGQILKTDFMLYTSNTGGYSQLCSSMLKNTGKVAKQSTQEQLDAWSCLYSPANLRDGNPATAWAEGVPGNGIGEFVIVAVDVDRKIKIWTGYGKSDALYHQNSRPKKIKLHVVKVKKNPSQLGDHVEELSLVASSSPITLKDFNGYQDLPSIPFKPRKEDENSFYVYLLGIEILEAYPGSKYKDLCISEVSN